MSRPGLSPDHYKLGALRSIPDPRTLPLARYLTAAALEAPPAACDWLSKLPVLGAMANDRLGDCVIAAGGHAHQAWSFAAAGREDTPADAEVIRAYSAVTGYNPATGANDNGTAPLDFLNYWRREGVGGRRIAGYAQVPLTSPADLATLRWCVWALGGVHYSTTLPQSALGATVWDNPYGPTAGGHAVWVGGYDAAQGQWLAVTWGYVVRITDRFLIGPMGLPPEVYAPLSHVWDAAGRAPSGLDTAALLADIRALGGDPGPAPAPPPPPPPPKPAPPTPTPPPAPFTIDPTDLGGMF